MAASVSQIQAIDYALCMSCCFINSRGLRGVAVVVCMYNCGLVVLISKYS